MENFSRKLEWVLAVLTLLPLVYLAFIWRGLPADVPTHFNAQGQPDDYNSKEALGIGVVLFSVFNYLLLRFIPALDPKKGLQSASYGRIRFTVTIFMSGLTILILYIIQSEKSGPVVADLILPFVSLLLAALGNVMLTVPQNYFVGIKTPWALASEANWRKTHRMAGWLWVGGGLLAFFTTLVLPTSLKTPVFLSITLLLALIPYIYSYRLFKQGLAVVLLALLGASAQAQSEETLRYVVTQPVGMSLTLEGTLTLPATTRKRVPVVLLIAGSGPTDRNGNSSIPGFGQINTFRQLADSLVKRGVAVFRYDKRGSGLNLMTYARQMNNAPLDFNFMADDAAGFIRQLQADKRFSSVTVAGHSEGALVGMLAAVQTKANRFISIAGPGQNIAEILKKQFADGGVEGDVLATATRDLDSLKAGLLVKNPPKSLVSIFSTATQPYLISWMKHDPAVLLNTFKGPVLILQGRHDIQVSITEAERLKAAQPKAKLVFFDKMSHILKEAPADRAENAATYNNPKLTIMPALADTIAAFVL
ncbi:alpha/beta fold hydrolase [Fibrella aquatica]|uniref:alpha/beta fold hydrolase n=1 Tax=Fibrella aquatica TaxID=3242487 RepID=UPI00351F8C69